MTKWWVVEGLFESMEFIGGAHGTSFDAEDTMEDLVGKIDRAVTIFEDLGFGGNRLELLCILVLLFGLGVPSVNIGFGGDRLALLCDVDVAGTEGFELFRGGEAKAGGENLSGVSGLVVVVVGRMSMSPMVLIGVEKVIRSGP